MLGTALRQCMLLTLAVSQWLTPIKRNTRSCSCYNEILFLVPTYLIANSGTICDDVKSAVHIPAHSQCSNPQRTSHQRRTQNIAWVIVVTSRQHSLPRMISPRTWSRCCIAAAAVSQQQQMKATAHAIASHLDPALCTSTASLHPNRPPDEDISRPEEL